MIYDLQKASVLKRISAWLLDTILLLVTIAGIAGLLSIALGFESHTNTLQDHYTRYEKEYGVTFELTQEQYDALTPEKKENYDAAAEALTADKDAIYTYNLVINLTLVIVSLAILFGYLVMEFLVPILLKNGQTLGKKVFGIAVIRRNGVRINNVCLFIRTVLGKCTIETMIPVLMVVMLMFGTTGILGTVVVFGLMVAQLALLIANRDRCVIHDLLADTVTVDMASQMIFNSTEELLEYKKRMSAEEAAKQSYF
jgi:uncharacterized RDD family membrane protein YckC